MLMVEWVVKDKAEEYLQLLLECDPGLTFRRWKEHFDRKYGDKESEASAQTKFNNAKQMEGETIEEWAHRILILAHRANRDRRPEVINRIAVQKFCVGCINKTAGEYVVNQQLEDLDTAVTKVKNFCENRQAIQGGSRNADLPPKQVYRRNNFEPSRRQVEEVREVEEIAAMAGPTQIAVAELTTDVSKLKQSVNSLHAAMTQLTLVVEQQKALIQKQGRILDRLANTTESTPRVTHRNRFNQGNGTGPMKRS